jgi:hypothetical protein
MAGRKLINGVGERLMKIKLIAFAITILITSSTISRANEILIKTGFISGNKFMKMGLSKNNYLMGVIDGIFLSPFFEAEKSKLRWIETCVTGMSDYQITAIVDKYMNDNPIEWHESMNIIVYRAFSKSCPDSPYIDKLS